MRLNEHENPQKDQPRGQTQEWEADVAREMSCDDGL